MQSLAGERVDPNDGITSRRQALRKAQPHVAAAPEGKIVEAVRLSPEEAAQADVETLLVAPHGASDRRVDDERRPRPLAYVFNGIETQHCRTPRLERSPESLFEVQRRRNAWVQWSPEGRGVPSAGERLRFRHGCVAGMAGTRSAGRHATRS